MRLKHCGSRQRGSLAISAGRDLVRNSNGSKQKTKPSLQDEKAAKRRTFKLYNPSMRSSAQYMQPAVIRALEPGR